MVALVSNATLEVTRPYGECHCKTEIKWNLQLVAHYIDWIGCSSLKMIKKGICFPQLQIGVRTSYQVVMFKRLLSALVLILSVVLT